MIRRSRAMLGRMPAPAWMMLALVIGFAAGVAFRNIPAAVFSAELVGGIWLDCLRMTIIPLVFALITTGIASLNLRADGNATLLGRRLLLVLAALLIMSALIAALVAPLMIDMFTMPRDSVLALRAVFPAGPAPQVPGAVEAVRAVIPTNVFASAATGAIVPIVIFALVLGLALSRVDKDRAHALLQPLRGLADAMVVVVGWILRVAVVGIGALAFTVGATVGVTAIGLLGQYLVASVGLSLLLIAIGYLIARIGGPVPFSRFARAIAPAQAVAAGTQSSIATLPAMLASAEDIGIASRDASVILPIAVSVFKITAPSQTLLIGLTVAWMGGVHVSPGQILLAIPLALLSTLVILGMPGVIGSYAGTAPIILALGAPLELLPIFMAVDVIPDMFRTVANVTYDVAAAAVIAPPGKQGPESGEGTPEVSTGNTDPEPTGT